MCLDCLSYLCGGCCCCCSNRRKWLPGLVKFQGKSDRTAVDRPLVKKGSEKNLKFPLEKQLQETDNKRNVCAVQQQPHLSQAALLPPSQSDLEVEDDQTVELPPAMEPIQDPPSLSNCTMPKMQSTSDASGDSPCQRISSLSLKIDGNSTVDMEEIEQLVKEKMEQHSKSVDNASSVGEVLQSLPSPAPDNDNKNDNLTDVETSLRKRMYALEELVCTEEAYVQDLALIVDGYLAEIRNPNSDIPIPDDLKDGKLLIVFSNIEKIFVWHRDNFLKAMRECLRTTDKDVGKYIRGCERKLHMYYEYCQNKPKSEFIVAEQFAYFEAIRIKLKHKLTICDLLIKPVQRIMKYDLMLQDIYKHSKRAGLDQEMLRHLEESCRIMKIVPKMANEMMDVGRLQNFEFKTTSQGPLLLSGKLMCAVVGNTAERSSSSGIEQKQRELKVFLFEQIIIFSEIVGKQSMFTNSSYIYKNHLQLNKTSLELLPDNYFQLRSTDPQRQEITYKCRTESPELHRTWVDTLNKIFKNQNDFLQAINNPIRHQEGLTKESSIDSISQYSLNSSFSRIENRHELEKQKSITSSSSMSSGCGSTITEHTSLGSNRLSDPDGGGSIGSNNSSGAEFLNRYLTHAELGRGRYGIVRLASDCVTKQHIALKQISRRYQSLESTQAEYKLLVTSHHQNLVRGLAFFEGAPQEGIDTIAMELVKGPQFLSFVAQGSDYSEAFLVPYIRQLMNGLLWLHQRGIAHLDIRPENILIHLSNVTNPTLKLIDFGSAYKSSIKEPLPLSYLEFAAPEMILGQAMGTYTDSWSVGVLLYVALSGFSPFLDDSIEETTTHILKCDFSFPEDYFGNISKEGQLLIAKLLVLHTNYRAGLTECLQSTWMTQEPRKIAIKKSKLESFIERRMRTTNKTCL